MTDTTHTAPLTDTGWGFRLLVLTICSATFVLTGWVGAQARAVEQRLDRVAQQIPHTPVRQIEQVQQAAVDLTAIEYSELNRFRNRAPASALPALDAEIDRLRAALFPPAGDDA